MSSAICFNLDQFKNLSSGNELIHSYVHLCGRLSKLVGSRTFVFMDEFLKNMAQS